MSSYILGVVSVTYEFIKCSFILQYFEKAMKFVLRKPESGAKQMCQQLRALAALADHLGKMYGGLPPYITSVPGALMLSSDILRLLHACGPHLCIQVHTHIHTVK